MKNAAKLLLITVFVAVATIMILTGRQTAADAAEPAENAYRIGIVNMNHLAHSYSKAEQFYQKAGEVQGKMRELQEAEDYEGMMALDQEMRDLQEQIMADFEADVQRVAEGLLADLQLNFIVTEIIAKPAGVEIVDVMPAFMASEYFHPPAFQQDDDCSSCGPTGCEH